MLCEGYFALSSLFFLTKGADLQEFPAVELKKNKPCPVFTSGVSRSNVTVLSL
jgi:hypothetical protein